MALKRLYGTILFLAFLVTLTLPACAQRWEYLGEANLDGDSDHDRIRVDDREGLFRAIQIRVQRAPVDFDRVVAHFESGQSANLRVNAVVRAGGSTRQLDLPGVRRKLRSVEVWYRRAARNRGEKPKIRLFGIR